MTKILQRPTLILNRLWQAVHVAPVARAIALVFRGQARFVDPEDYQLFDWEDWARLTPQEGESFIQTPRQKLRVPEVVVLAGYDRQPRGTVNFSRRNLFRRDEFTCQYCGRRPGSADLTIDHIVPRSRGGTSTWENCVLACLACNSRKADRSLTESRMTLRSTPRRPQWKPIYARETLPMASWAKFVSEAYWNVTMEE